MLDVFNGFDPVVQAFVATLFTWGMTALGASLVFLGKKNNQKVLDGMLAFSGGVMIAASFWSLLAPAIEMAESNGTPSWLPTLLGFLLGGLFLLMVDRLLPLLEANDRFLYDIKDKKGKTPHVTSGFFNYPSQCT